MRGLSPALALALLLILLPAAPAQVVSVAPDHPLLRYSEFVEAQVTSERARFVRDDVLATGNNDSPGTRVSLTTDALQVRVGLDHLTACLLPLCRTFRVEIDGVLQPEGHSTLVPGVNWFTILDQPTPEPRLVTLIYPVGADVDLVGVELVGGSGQLLAQPPARPPFTWVAFGDSVTLGSYGSTITESYPHRVAAQRGWSVVNMGYAGHGMVAADGAVLGGLHADLLSIALGTNDFELDVPGPQFRAAFEGLLDGLRAQRPTLPVVVITPTFRQDEHQPNGVGLTLEDYRRRLRDVVAERRTSDLRLHLIEGLDLLGDEPQLFSDEVHPNNEGFAQIAARLAPFDRVGNGSFEAGTIRWETEGPALVTRAADAPAGTRVLTLGPASSRAVTEIGGVSPGSPVTVSAWVQGGARGEKATLRVDLLDASGALTATKRVKVIHEDWEQVTLELEAPPHTAWGRIELSKPAGAATARFDEVCWPLPEPGYVEVLQGPTTTPGSLTVTGGAPQLGSGLTLTLDDPATAGDGVALAALIVGMTPLAPPSGQVSGDWSGPLLVDVSAGTLSAVVFGPTWQAGVPVDWTVPIPFEPALGDLTFFVQGALVGPGATSGIKGLLTGAVQVHLGP